MALPATILSQDEEATLFEVLGIPYTTTGYTLTDDLGSVRSSAAITPAVTILPEIEAFFTGGVINGITYLPISVGVLARIRKYLARWNELGTTVTKISDGAISDLTRISDDPKDERAVIREFIRNSVPFYTRYAYLLKQQGDGVSSHGEFSGGSSQLEMVR
jgi:hypothetical protein